MNRGRRRIARWLAGGLFIAAAAGGVLIDAAFVGTEAPGYCPADAAWTVHTADAGVFWRNLERSDAYRVLETARPQPLRAFDREVHIRTGIRPASWRWRIWMGKSLLVAGGESGWGASFRPGVLLRAYHIVRAPFAASEGGVFSFGDLFYAWRDGFVVASPSEAYVVTALRDEAPAARGIQASEPGTARVVIRAEPRLAATIEAADGLPVSGTIETPVTAMETPIARSTAMESGAGLTVYARSFRDMAALWRAARSHTPTPAIAAAPMAETAALWTSWAIPPLPSEWDGGSSQAAASWLDFDLSQTPPVPGFGAQWQGGASHPLSSWAEALGTVPYEWSGQPGTASPLLGAAAQLCLARRDEAWFAATNEPLMARTAAVAPLDAGALDADVALFADYAVLGDWLRALLEEAGRLGVARGVGRDDILANYGAWLDGAASMGRLRLQGRMDGDVLRFEGMLAEGAEMRDAR